MKPATRIIKHHRVGTSTFGAVRHASSVKANTQYTAVTHPEDPLSIPADVSSTLARHSAYVLNTYARPPFILSHGKGSWVYDTNGREYLDFSAGIAVNALGHGDEELSSVMAEQASKLLHSSNVYHNEWAGELAQLVVELTKRDGGLGWVPGAGSTSDSSALSSEESSPSAAVIGSIPSSGAKVFFANSGTEANEGALKFARKVGKVRWAASNASSAAAGTDCSKTGIVCFESGFHGRSMGALSVTTNPKYQAPFAPLLPGVAVGKLNDIQGLDGLITEETCGVIVEPVQGEGGVRASDEAFLRALRKKCDEVGAVLIFDEIQCGLYRTGSLWAHSQLPADCHPDVVTMAKPMANGYPLGAILARDTIAEAMTVGSHGTTFGGSPLATRLGHHVLSRLSNPFFLSSLHSSASLLNTRISHLPTLFPNLLSSDVRGRGLIRGLAFKPEHAQDGPGKLVKGARERGVLLLTAGSDAVRFVPSLNVKESEVEKCVDVVESVLGLM